VEGEDYKQLDWEDDGGKGESAWKKKLRKLRRRRRDFVVDGGWAGDVLEDTDIDEED
jgi:hypothetical protein